MDIPAATASVNSCSAMHRRACPTCHIFGETGRACIRPFPTGPICCIWHALVDRPMPCIIAGMDDVTPCKVQVGR